MLIFFEEEGNNRFFFVVIGEGKMVDLFKLFVLVREGGGFDLVFRKGLWDLVVGRLGLDCLVFLFLRLVYFKYLDWMEKWVVEKLRIVNWDDGDSKKKGCYGGLLYELGDGFKGLLENGKCLKCNRVMFFGCRYVEEFGFEFYSFRKRFRECEDDDDEEVGMFCVVFSDDFEEEGLVK